MSNEIVTLDSIRDRVRAVLADMIPPEAWDRLIEEAYQDFIKHPDRRDNFVGRPDARAESTGLAFARRSGVALKTFRYEEYKPSEDIVWFGFRDDEELDHDDLDDCIEATLDDIDQNEWPESLTIAAFRRRIVDDGEQRARRLLDALIDDLDEEYGGPDSAEPNDVMRRAADVFVVEVLLEYKVYQCEPVEEIVVPTRDWVQAHRPDWIEATPES